MMHWVELARAEIGQKAVPGSKHNPRVLAYYKDAGHSEIKNDETAWCAAFVGAMLHRAGLPNTNSLMARSYLKYGTPITEPKAGAIVVFSRGSSSWQGHVAFVDRWDAKYIYCLGGNQSNRVNVSAYPRSRVLGYRWPPVVVPEIAKPQSKIVLGFQALLQKLGIIA